MRGLTRRRDAGSDSCWKGGGEEDEEGRQAEGSECKKTEEESPTERRVRPSGDILAIN